MAIYSKILAVTLLLAATLTSCVFVDDCNWRTTCETLCNYTCDYYGRNCVTHYCWDECHEELYCY